MKVITEEDLIASRNKMLKQGKNIAACLVDELIHECQEIDTLTVSNKPALEILNEIEMEVNKKESPLERLRFFCSLAMNGQDWLDSEKFFDDLESVDTLTVSKLRPMCDAPKDRSLFEVYHKESPIPRECYFCNGSYIVDGYELHGSEFSGWHPKVIYKPELTGE